MEIQSVELQIKNEEYSSSVKKSEIDKLNHSLQNAQVLSEAEGIIQEINTTPKTDASGQPAPFISILCYLYPCPFYSHTGTKKQCQLIHQFRIINP